MFDEPDFEVTRDLMTKVTNDIKDLMLRVALIAPPPTLPLALAACAATLGILSLEIRERMDPPRDPGEGLDPDLILLAGLMAARVGEHGPGCVALAYEDMEVLEAAGRLPSQESAEPAKEGSDGEP